MPQLMPLNWFSAKDMMYMILFSACMMYSEILKINVLLKKKNNKLMKLNYWCW